MFHCLYSFYIMKLQNVRIYRYINWGAHILHRRYQHLNIFVLQNVRWYRCLNREAHILHERYRYLKIILLKNVRRHILHQRHRYVKIVLYLSLRPVNVQHNIVDADCDISKFETRICCVGKHLPFVNHYRSIMIYELVPRIAFFID